MDKMGAFVGVIMELERRIAKAKTALILEHPFFGNLAMNMPFEITGSTNSGD